MDIVGMSFDTMTTNTRPVKSACSYAEQFSKKIVECCIQRTCSIAFLQNNLHKDKDQELHCSNLLKKFEQQIVQENFKQLDNHPLSYPLIQQLRSQVALFLQDIFMSRNRSIMNMTRCRISVYSPAS